MNVNKVAYNTVYAAVQNARRESRANERDNVASPKKTFLLAGAGALATIGAFAALLQANAGGPTRPVSHLPTFASNSGVSTSDSDGESLGVALQQTTKIGQMDDTGKTVWLTANLLGKQHYSQKPMDDEISSRLLDRYMESLDVQRLLFTQADVKEFEKYRTQLDDLTLVGDITPATEIFDRFKERLKEQIAFSSEALKTEKFDFTGNETYNTDRKKAAYPANAEEQKALWLQNLRYQYLLEKLAGHKPDEINKTLTRRLARIERAYLKEFDKDDMVELYLNALAHVYDPHSDFFGKATNANFGITMRLSLVGIGATLVNEDGYTKIVELVTGGPAMKSKLVKPGDRIVAVRQGDNGETVDVIDMKIDKVVEMIRGEKGTPVTLTIIPADAPDMSKRKVITLIRDEVKLEDQAAKAKLIEMPGVNGKPNRIGVIDLPGFYYDPDKGKSATADVRVLLKKLQQEGAGGIILDLRRNGGGSLQEAITLTGLFIKGGPVVQVRDPKGRASADDDDDPLAAYSGPLVVLTSHQSASASEIVAGALQDYGRALIVGDTSTFGKGTVQSVIGLKSIFDRGGMAMAEDPGALKLTVQKFYRPSGASTQLKGVIPDIVLPSLLDAIPYAEKSLDNPLPYDTIPPATFTRDNKTHGYITELKRQSDARVAKSADFTFLKSQVALLKKRNDEKIVSLNEAQRKAETVADEARIKARQTQLAARTPEKDRIYQITLGNALKPGLPLPVTAQQLADASLKSAAAKARARAADDTPEDDLLNDRIAEPDILLTEAEHIVSDYATLTKK